MPPASDAPTKSNVDQFELAAEPLWRGDAGWRSARFVDDVLLLENVNSQLAAVNPATGEQLWTAELDGRTSDTPVAKVGSETALIVNYVIRDPEPTTWIAAVRVRDASTLWQVPDGPHKVTDVMAADDQIVLLSVDDPRLPAARAISTSDGTTRWETPGLWPQLIAGDRVLGVVSSRPPRYEGGTDSYVVGLDAATGKKVWSLDGRYHYSRLGVAVGDVAVVYVRHTSDAVDEEAAVLIDLANGAEIDQLGWTYPDAKSCAGDDPRLIACGLAEEAQHPMYDTVRLVTFDVAKRAKHTSPRIREVHLKDVWRDYLFVADHAMHAVDRDGIAVSGDLPGQLIGISADHAAFALPDRGAVAVYPIKT